MYKLDHLVRERYPTFVDALRDLDDALCLIHLFASLSPSKFVPAARVQACTKLAREFQAYVARTHGLRATFLSIKGTYYQAELFGVSVTWIVPHSFAQQPTMEARAARNSGAIRAQIPGAIWRPRRNSDGRGAIFLTARARRPRHVLQVDYRVMLSFLEFYEALLTFINFEAVPHRGRSSTRRRATPPPTRRAPTSPPSSSRRRRRPRRASPPPPRRARCAAAASAAAEAPSRARVRAAARASAAGGC